MIRTGLAHRLPVEVLTWCGGFVLICLGFSCVYTPEVLSVAASTVTFRDVVATYLHTAELQATAGTIFLFNSLPMIALAFVPARPYWLRLVAGALLGLALGLVLWFTIGNSLYII